MPQNNNVNELVINQLTKKQYNELKNNNQLSNTELYIISDNAYYTEEEIRILLNAKQNILTAGDGVTIENDIITINLDDFYTSNAIDELLSKKANISEAGYNFEYTDNILTLQNIDGEELSSVKIVSAPELDNVTINLNSSNQLQSIGEITRNGIPKYTWIGTQEEYNQAELNGTITELTEILIIDSEAETLTPVVQYNAPTKLSELANDMYFIKEEDLQNTKEELQNKIDAKIDDTNLVHKTGTETIDGFKQFKQKIIIENTDTKGRIAHKPSESSLEDGYIEFGDNTLVYGKQNIDGELFDEKHNIFHESNLTAGKNIFISKEDNIYKINSELVDSANTNLDNLSEIGENKLSNLVINKADIDLNNLSEVGENKLNNLVVDKANKATTLNGYGITDGLNISQITNCLLEVPQRIKYTLEDGTLTIKKGSQVIVPYGTTNENFIRVGSPTITDNGVASGFTLNDYIKMPSVQLGNANTWEMFFKIKTPAELPSTNYVALNGSAIDYQIPRIAIRSNGRWVWSIPNDTGTAWQKEYWGTLDVVELNTDYYFKMSFTGSAYKLDYSFNGIDWDNMVTYESTLPVYNLSTEMYLGRGFSIAWTGSIDLTQFSITVDGEVVYRPYLQKGDRFLNDNFKVYDTQFSDGKFFVWAEIQEDISRQVSGNGTNESFVQVSLTRNSFWIPNIGNSTSGSTDGTISAGCYYNTSTNLFKNYDHPSDVTALPCMIIQGDGTYNTGKVNQVFNGMGYIGSCQWYDKDIVGLSPNGFNPDGTYKNIEVRRTKLAVRDFGSGSTTLGYVWALSAGGNRDYVDYFVQDTQPALSGNWLWHNTLNNQLYGYTSSAGFHSFTGHFVSGFGHRTNNVVDSFNPKQPFRAVDYNDKSEISGWSMPSSKYIDLPLGASGTTYTAPANGKYYLAKISGATGFRNIALSNVTAHYLVHDYSENTTDVTLNANLEAKKGDIVRIDYTAAGSTIDFKFIYAEGEV